MILLVVSPSPARLRVIADRGWAGRMPPRSSVTLLPRSAASGRHELEPSAQGIEMAIGINGHENVNVFVGLDVGKTNHHAVARTVRQCPYQRRGAPATHPQQFELLRHGTVVDQPTTAGAIPVAAAQDAGVMVGYLPGLAMRRIARPAPRRGQDARDAFINAEAARTLPHTLRSIDLGDEQIAQLTMLCGFDDGLAVQIAAASNRIRGLLTQIHPALERVLGPRIGHRAVLDLLQRYP